ncbi:hypothetical protein [Lysobacter gummosus]|uniref:hypothetical protein n=1 Tax=Lysobacter gummosus TaxID=262324 RepID=UPI003637CD4E
MPLRGATPAMHRRQSGQLARPATGLRCDVPPVLAQDLRELIARALQRKSSRVRARRHPTARNHPGDPRRDHAAAT